MQHLGICIKQYRVSCVYEEHKKLHRMQQPVPNTSSLTINKFKTLNKDGDTVLYCGGQQM